MDIQSLYDNTKKAYTAIEETLGEKISVEKNLKNLASVLTQVVEEASSVVKAQFTTSGTATVRNLWSGNIVVNGTVVPSGLTTSFTVTPGYELTIEEGSDGAFRTWTNSGEPFIKGAQVELKSMPKMKAFTTDKEGKIAGDYFFYGFNSGGSITSYPEGSFDTSEITTFGDQCFRYFNRYNTVITSLPEGSFRFDSMVKAGTHFCQNFNREATGLKTLPAGSFRFPELVEVGGNMFSSFNLQGAFIKLPVGSFQFPKLKTINGSFAYFFNGTRGQLTKLPKDSFDMSAVTTAPESMFEAFNGSTTGDGRLEYSATSYTNTKNMTTRSEPAYYYSRSETVAPGGYFHWAMDTE